MRRYSKPIRKYLRQIWVLLPCSYKEKRAILSMLDKTLREYVITNPMASYEAIKEHFGEPEEIVCAYFHHLDSASLLKKWSTRKKASRILLVTATTLLVVLCITSAAKKHINSDESNEPKEVPVYINQVPDHATEVDKLEQQLKAYKSALEQADSSK